MYFQIHLSQELERGVLVAADDDARRLQRVPRSRVQEFRPAEIEFLMT